MRNSIGARILTISVLVTLGPAVQTRTSFPLAAEPSHGRDAGQRTRESADASRPQTGWQSLFDGKTTKGWRGFKQKTVPAGWQVVDGALTRVGDGGDIMTVELFDNFELQLEWMVAEGGNSGIMFRVSEDAEETYHTGPEFQVLDNARHKDGRDPLTSAGACYGLYAPIKDASRPAGAWNSVRLVVNGTAVEHWLNGVMVVRYELLSPDWEQRVAASKFKEWPDFGRVPRGHIVLQDHGDRVAYRRIRIRKLEAEG